MRQLARLLVVLFLFALHFVASKFLLFQAYKLDDSYWTRTDPALAVPGWDALLFFLPVFAALGVASALWNRRGAVLRRSMSALDDAI